MLTWPKAAWVWLTSSWRRIPILLLIGLLCFFYAFVAATYRPDAQSAESASEQQASDQPSNFLAKLAAPADDFARRYEKLFIVFGTVVLAIFTVLLWDSTHKLWKDAVGQGVTSNIAATAARDSADAYMRAERAWLSFTKGAIAYHHNMSINGTHVGDGAHIELVFTNSGRSPALDMEYWITPTAFPIGADPPGFTKSGLPSGSAPVGPGADFRTEPCGINSKLLEGMRGKTSHLYIWVLVEYRTIHSPNAVRTTESCLRVRINGQSGGEDAHTLKDNWVVQPVGPQNRMT